MSKILVIEDQEDVKEVTKAMLELQGHAPTMADTPQHGVDLAINDNFDLALIDIMMPGMDGYQVLNAIRKSKKVLKCIAFTAKASGAEIDELVKKGFDGFIIKPFTMSEFKEKINQLLK